MPLRSTRGICSTQHAHATPHACTLATSCKAATGPDLTGDPPLIFTGKGHHLYSSPALSDGASAAATKAATTKLHAATKLPPIPTAEEAATHALQAAPRSGNGVGKEPTPIQTVGNPRGRKCLSTTGTGPSNTRESTRDSPRHSVEPGQRPWPQRSDVHHLDPGQEGGAAAPVEEDDDALASGSGQRPVDPDP